MHLDPEDENVKAASLGKMAEDFLSGPIGEYLVARAKEEIDEGLRALRTVNPNDADKVRAAQNAVAVPERSLAWIGQIIDRGQAAMQILRDEHG